MPWSAGLRPSAPGTNTESVFFDPALTIRSRETSRKMPISIMPRATPTRVEIEMPRYTSHHTISPQRTARGSHRKSFEKPVNSVLNDAPNSPNDANSAAGTTGSASRKAHAMSQPATGPRPRATYVYMPPADGRKRASSPIEYAVNSAAMSARTTASGVLPPAYRVAAPRDRAVATAGAMWVIDWNRTSVSPIAFRSRLVPPVDDATQASSPSHASGWTWARTPDILTVPAVADKGLSERVAAGNPRSPGGR